MKNLVSCLSTSTPSRVLRYFQYAQILEYAPPVFWSQVSAKDWLGRSCKYLDNVVPLDVVDEASGFRIVWSYLERIEHGVYQ